MYESLKEWINGWRHGRGFGVHSPWAYEVVTTVLRCDCGYYAYGEIDKLFGERRALAATVYRLLVHEQPERIIVIGDSRWDRLAHMVNPMGPGVKKRPVTAVSVDDASKVSADDLIKLTEAKNDASEKGIIILTDLTTENGKRLWKNLRGQSNGYSITIVGKMAVLNRRADLPTQHLRTFI